MAILIPRKKEFWQRRPTYEPQVDYGHYLADDLTSQRLFIDSFADENGEDPNSISNVSLSPYGLEVTAATANCRIDNPLVSGGCTIEMLVASDLLFTTENGSRYFFDTYEGSNKRTLLYYDHSVDRTFLYTNDSNRGFVSGGIPIQGSKELNTSIAITIPSNKMYVDGELFHTFSSGDTGTIADNLYIGNRFNLAESLGGHIELFRTYKREISENEIYSLYENRN